MAKRETEEDADGASAYRKRQRMTPAGQAKRPQTAYEAPTSEEIYDSEQLRRLLAFDQNLKSARHGLQSFKVLLDGIREKGEHHVEQMQILREYLEAVQPRTADEESVWLSDIFEMWSFAAQVHDGGVMSSVVVVLALLLQTVSGSLELVKHGLGVCQTLLHEQPLKTLAKNLSAQRSEGFILSPTLRFLREAVCLDGGAYATKIFRARESTFTQLGRNLEIAHMPENPENETKRASVRSHAVAFLLSCLKYLHSNGRNEVLQSKDQLISHLTYNIINDSPYLIGEILDGLRQYILLDEKIPRSSKARTFTPNILIRFLRLCDIQKPTDSSSSSFAVTVGDKAHAFLLHVCTTPTAGILYRAPGLYPMQSEDAERHAPANGGFAVHNFKLAELAQNMRPWHSMKHAELLVASFKSAPELVADYFLKKGAFSFDPKLSMTWIGYGAFLFDTMMIPMPAAFGDEAQYAKAPPPTSILLDNILPSPVTNKVFNKCLSSDSQLFSFFATRLLVIALEKLESTIKLLESGFRSLSALWKDAVKELVGAFCRRVPDMGDLVRSYKSVPADNLLHRTLSSRLLRLYHEVIPRVALAANFDVSPFFATVLANVYDDKSDAETRSFGMIELENLVSIASYSPGMKWFNRSEKLAEGISLSPFTALLRLSCQGEKGESSSNIISVLQTVAIENQLVSETTAFAALVEAVQGLHTMGEGEILNKAWGFLDNCITRCASTQLKYIELLEAHIEKAGSEKERKTIGLLTEALAEQLPFATASAEKSEKQLLARFLSEYFTSLNSRAGKQPVLTEVYQAIRDHLKSQSVKVDKLSKSSSSSSSQSSTTDETTTLKTSLIPSSSSTPSSTISQTHLSSILYIDSTTPLSPSALTKHPSIPLEDILESDILPDLFHLLSSSEIQHRKESLLALLKIAQRFKESDHEDKDQLYLLLMEVAESSRPLVDINAPLPSFFIAFAEGALAVLKDPLHPLYGKINTFLTSGPVWRTDGIPMLDKILHDSPSQADKLYTEIAWLLPYLLQSLQTPSDLEIFRRRRVFEPLFALLSNPFLKKSLRTGVLRIVYRATEIDGGSTTLETRFGVLGWLKCREGLVTEGEEGGVMRALRERLWETCDQERVGKWSCGMLGREFEEGKEKLDG